MNDGNSFRPEPRCYVIQASYGGRLDIPLTPRPAYKDMYRLYLFQVGYENITIHILRYFYSIHKRKVSGETLLFQEVFH